MSATFGSLVLVVRRGFDGEVETAWLPAAAAVFLVLYDADNGVKWYSAHIVADDVDMGQWDRSV